MGKNKDKMVSVAQSPGFHHQTLREKITGRKQFNGGMGSSNLKSVLKMQHFKNLSLWAGGEADLPSLGALFGHHLAVSQEAAGTVHDPSLFQCQRCESILQPGYNCTIRIEKHGGKMRQRRKKSNIPTKNNVVYTCHFCSHRNLKRGTPKEHIKELVASKPKPVSELEPKRPMDQASVSSDKSMVSNKGEISKKAREAISSVDIAISKCKIPEVCPDQAKMIPTENSPQERTQTVLSECKKRNRKGSGTNNSNRTEDNKTAILEAGSGGTSRKRRKSWSSLREIAENSEREKMRNFANLTVPFFL